ncbi:MAG: tetratricopeptide repeat protein [Bacteroidales bacterium]|nr:tetratricopeptide repeat protein [Bacteroidales bacterium]
MQKLVLLFVFFMAFYANAQTLQEQADALESDLADLTMLEKMSAYNNLAELYLGLDHSKAEYYLELIQKESNKNGVIEQRSSVLLIKAKLRYLHSRNEEAKLILSEAVAKAKIDKDTLSQVQSYQLLISVVLTFADIDTAEAYNDSILTIVEQKGDSILVAHYLFGYGELLKAKGDFANSVKALNESLALFKALKEDEKIIEVLSSLGYMYYKNYFYNQGQIYFDFAARFSEQIGNWVQLSYAYSYIANNFFSQKKYTQALIFYEKAIFYSQESNDLNALAGLYSNLSVCLIELGDYDQALQYLRKSEEVENKSSNYHYKPYQVTNYGRVYYAQKNYEKAIQYYNQSLPLLKEVRSLSYVATNYFMLANSYYRLGDTLKAFTYVDSAKAEVDNAGQMSLFQSYHKSYYKFLMSLADTSHALVQLEKYNQYRDSSEVLRSHAKLIFESDILQGSLQKENVSLKKSVELKQEKVLKLQIMVYSLIGLSLIIIFMIIAIYRIRTHRKLKEVNVQLSDMVDTRTRKLKEEIRQKAIIEEELREINDRYEKLTQSIPDITWSSRINNDGSYTLVYLSPQIQTYANHTIDEYKIDPEIWINEVVHPDDYDSVFRINQRVNSGELPVVEIDYRIIDKNTNIKWIHEKINVTREIDGVRLDAIISDNTRQKETEIELRESREQLESLNATKDKFFSIIAHDLKNPFNSILGFANLLNENYDEFDKEEHLVFIHNIINASDGAYKLLQNLLEWSRSQTGGIEVKAETFDLSEIVNTNLSLLSPLAHNKKIHLNSEVVYGTHVYADKNMINTVVRNLIQNAIKFSYPESEIVLKADMGQEYVYFSVVDHGVGISEAKLGQLFQIGAKVQAKGTANELGTGLGLILCKEFIEQNRGEIKIESILGQGSTFTISIPMDKLML